MFQQLTMNDVTLSSTSDSPSSVARKSVDHRELRKQHQQQQEINNNGSKTGTLPSIKPMLRGNSFDFICDEESSKRLKLPQIQRDGERLLSLSRDSFDDSSVQVWAPLSPTDKSFVDLPQLHLRHSYKVKAKSCDSIDFKQLASR
jgi:hypothetical protein